VTGEKMARLNDQSGVEHPVFVSVRQFAKKPKHKVFSVVRLQGLKDCLRIWPDAPHLTSAVPSTELPTTPKDWKQVVGTGGLSVEDDKLPEQVVKGAAGVVQNVPDADAPFQPRWLDILRREDMATAFRIEISGDSVRVSLNQELRELPLQSFGILTRAFYLEPTTSQAVNMTRRHKSKQKTSKGYEIPVPKRGEFIDNLKKAADAPPERPKKSRKK
jgi:hypothetical protein